MKTNKMICAMFPESEINKLSKLYSDQTGGFPVCSATGNKYIFVLYHYNISSIHAVLIKSRHANHIIQSWKQIYNLLKYQGETPELHILYNECSANMIHSFKSLGVAYQLVPPHLHRRNEAERAIRTFKNHLIAGLCTCHPKLPTSYWDYLIPQTTLTLDPLRSSRRNPSLSSHAAVFGQPIFNATPLASPGTKVIIYDNTRKTFWGSWP